MPVGVGTGLWGAVRHSVSSPVFARPWISSLEGGAVGGAAGSFVRATTAYYQSDTAGTLVQAASGAARFGFLGALNKSGLMIEGSAVNAVNRSQQMDLWTASVPPCVVGINAATAPDGTATAETLTSVSANSYIESASASAVNGTQYVFSVYGLADAATTCKQAIVDLANGVPNIVATINLTTAYQRFVTALFTADAELSVGARLGCPGGGFPTARTLTFWGAQIESMAGGAACPTSYIPTTTGPAQRNIDELSYSVPGTVTPAQGTLSCWVQLPWTADTSDRTAIDLAGTGVNGFVLYANGSGSKPKIQYGTGGATNTITSTTALTGVGTFDHLLVTWSPAGVTLFLNGVSVGTSATAPSLVLGVLSMFLGGVGSASAFLGGLIRNLKIWNRVIGGAEIATDFAAGA